MSNIQTPDLSGQTIADTPPINAPADPVAARALANRVDGALPDQRVYSIETRLSAARRASQEVLHWMPINRHSNGEVLVDRKSVV